MTISAKVPGGKQVDIYLVVYYEYEGYDVLGAFSNEDDANAFAEAQRTKSYRGLPGVETYTLDKEL